MCVRACGCTAEAAEFKKKFEEAQEINAGLLGATATVGGEDDGEADELAKEVEEKATVAA